MVDIDDSEVIPPSPEKIAAVKEEAAGTLGEDDFALEVRREMISRMIQLGNYWISSNLDKYPVYNGWENQGGSVGCVNSDAGELMEFIINKCGIDIRGEEWRLFCKGVTVFTKERVNKKRGG